MTLLLLLVVASLASGVWRLMTLFQLHQGAQEVLRVDERDALAVHVALLLARSEHARAFFREPGGRGGHVVHLEAEMVDAARGVALEELRDRRIRARGLHQLDAGVRQLDVGHPHALLIVDLRRADIQPVDLFQALRRRVEARHHDGYVAQSGDHMIFSARNCAMRCADSPSSALRISSVCSPRSGGARRIEGGVSLMRNGMPSIFRSPAFGCLTVRTMSRAAVCGLSSASATLLIGPHGTPTARSFSIQAAVLPPFRACVIESSSTSRFATRPGFFA